MAIVLDTQNRIADLNPAALHMVGMTKLQVIGQPANIVFAAYPQLADALQNPPGEHTEIAVDHAGTKIYLDLHLSPLHNQKGELTGQIVLGRDVTGRNQAKAIVTASEERLRVITDNSLDIIMQVDANGIIQYLSPSFLSVLGHAQSVFHKKPVTEWVDSLHPENREYVQSRIQAKLDGNQNPPNVFVYRCQHAKGHYVWLETIVSPVLSQNGTIQTFIFTSRDITERKQIEDSLAERNRVLRLLHKMATEIGAELDLDTLLQHIVAHAIDLLDADRGGTIHIYDEMNDVLRLDAASGINGDSIHAVVKPGSGVTGRVFQSVQPLIVNNYTTWEGRTTVLVPSPPSAVMGIPLLVQRTILGVLVLAANSERRTFDEQDIQVATMFAAQVATVIQNAQSYQRAQQEIKERNRTAEALRAEKEFNDTMLNATPDTVFVFDPQTGRPLRWNKAFAQTVGYTHEEIAAQKALDAWYNAEDLARATAALSALYETNHASVEMSLISKDGSTTPFEYVAAPIMDNNGQLRYVVAIGRDITERKEADLALQASEIMLRALINAQTDSVFLAEIDGTILTVNEAAAVRFGRQAEDLIGRNAYDLMPPDVTESRRAQGDKVLHSGESMRFEDERAGMWFETTLSPVFEGDLHHITRLAVVARDITERKHAEQQQVALAIEREKVKLIADFITMTAHEFRTPLSTVNMNLALMDRAEDSQTQARRLDIIKQQLRFVSDLIDTMLKMTRLDSQTRLTLVPIRIGTLIRDLETRYGPEAEALSLKLVTDIDPTLPKTLANAPVLYDALACLVDNALSFTPEGGTITLRSYAEPDVVVIEVVDTGVGISAESLPYIFDRFYRVDKARTTRGTGLGLSIVKRAVDLHSGDIEVNSAIDQGSTFRIRLPICAK